MSSDKGVFIHSFAVFALVMLLLCPGNAVHAGSGTDVSGYDFQSPFSENGWTYYPNGSTSKYHNVTNVGYVTYNDQGQIISFRGRDAEGTKLFDESLTYVGNEVYNSEGEFIGHAYENGQSPGVQETARDDLKTSSRQIVRLMQSRIASILAPKPGVGIPEESAELRGRMEADRAALTAQQVAPGISGMEYRLDGGTATGIAAGEAASSQDLGLGVWLSGGMNFSGNSARSTKYDGYSGMLMLGADYMLSERTVVGLGFGVEGSYNETRFFGLDGKSGHSGYTIAPYMSVALFEHTLFNLISGISFLANADTTTAYNDSLRFMISPGVTQYFVLDNWLLSGALSYTYARETGYDYSSKSSSTLFSLPKVRNANLRGKPDPLETGELRIAGRAGYSLDFLQPYLEAGYIYDTLQAKGEDADEVEVIVGMDIYPMDTFIVSLEFYNSFFRENTYNLGFMANVRYEF
jgi:hypothetical protein